jgi:hypothetical protein
MMPSIPSFKRIVKRPHRHYRRSEIDPILNDLSHPILPRGAITRISKDTGIPKQTLSEWAHHRRDPTTPNWVLFEAGRPLKRVLAPAVEASLADHIRENWINTGKGAVRQAVQTLAKTAYASLPVEGMRCGRFAASASWLDAFMTRQGFSLRTPHPERRTPINEGYASHFLQRLNEARREYPLDHIFNFDETCWKRFLGPKRVLAEKGTEGVKLKSEKGEKESYTGYGCISAAGNKLPFWILAKGKTDLCHRKFKAPDDVIIRHTQNGWTNEAMMLEYVTWLSDQARGEPILLVLDVYPAHRTPKLQQRARELHVELLDVPAGETSQFQPLDRRIFGELKSRARRAFEHLTWRIGDRGATPEEAIAVLADAWRAISAENIRSAWELA